MLISLAMPLLALATASQASSPPPPAESLERQQKGAASTTSLSTTTEEVVVTGRSSEALDAFIEQVTQARQGRQIARWDRRICIRTLGLDSSHSAYAVGGIAKIAKTVDISIASGKCHANVIVVFTSDIGGFVDAFIKRYPKLFQDTSSGTDFLRSQRDTLRQSRPVRWVNASRTGPAVGGDFADGLNSIYSASRLAESTREYSVLSMAIVDPKQMNGLSWSQLVDYLAIVSLANPSMSATFSHNTILSMFRLRDEGVSPPKSMTDDDRALLHAIYGTSAAATADMQRKQIRSTIMRSKEYR